MAETMKVYASLHAHSTHSDGVYTPTELVHVAKDEGYRGFALTDHDTVSGNAEAMAECKRLGIEAIFGAEFTTTSRECGAGFHMTAFSFDPEEAEMKEYLWQLSENETNQTRVLFRRGVDIGYIKNITWDEVLEYNEGITWLCNEHVFRAMKAKGLITDLQYRDYFDTCFGPHRSTVPPLYPFRNTEELIPMVHRAGGIAVIAHPHDQLQHIKKLIPYGLDGIEVWHGDLPIAERREALRVARELDLYVSGGPDHNGLLGGEYARYEHPEQTEYYFPPLTLGTTRLFFEEIRDMKKNARRAETMDAMLADESLWITAGNTVDRYAKV